MTRSQSPIQTYQQERKQHQESLQKRKSIQSRISLARVVLVVLAGYGGWAYFTDKGYVWGIIALLSLVAFIVLINVFFRIQAKIRLLEALISINEEEIAYLRDRDISPFADGEEFTDPEHPYTFDLDIFGPESLFQHINRTATSIGKERLAAFFIAQREDEISARQEAMQELSAALPWRQHFQAQGRIHEAGDQKMEGFSLWLQAPPAYLHRWFLRAISFLFPALAIGGLIATFVLPHVLSTSLFLTAFFVNLGVVGYHSLRFKKEFLALDGISRFLNTYEDLLKTIAEQKFTAAWLQERHQAVTREESNAPEAIHALSKILQKFEYQTNPFVAILSNGFMMDAVHVLFKLERWKQRYAASVPGWLEVIADMDAALSMAGFCYNHPDFAYPTLSETPALHFEDAAHPLIPAGARVSNSVNFSGERFIILTGSNMAGKSTFLRTLGVNLLLCRMGLPLCAKSARLYPMEVFVSMKINDSLKDSESLFYAELKRLNRIGERAAQDAPVFVILDEILRGTNSNDKHLGTRSFIEQIVEAGAFGIIATHDLSIAALKTTYPDTLSNRCFEVDIEGDSIHFDYVLKEGVCQKMSAVFLMKQMEIIA